MIKNRLCDCERLKVLPIQKGKYQEKYLLKEHATSGVNAFILDNVVSREKSGSTGKRAPTQTVRELFDILGVECLFLAGALGGEEIRSIHPNIPLFDVDSGTHVAFKINRCKVRSIVVVAHGRLH